jgi:hypothetical protein
MRLMKQMTNFAQPRKIRLFLFFLQYVIICLQFDAQHNDFINTDLEPMAAAELKAV